MRRSPTDQGPSRALGTSSSTRRLRLGMGIAGVVASLSFVPGPSWAANVQERLDGFEAKVQEVSAKAEALFQGVAPGGGYIPRGEAVERFQDLMYLSMVGDHEAAAEGFFGLVTSGALTEDGLHWDAEWYLADSLFQLQNYETAESRFKVVADDPRHPFREDAIRRLLEIYALTGRLDAFGELYRQEIVRGRVLVTDLITYSVGKNFYVAGDRAQATRQFAQIPPTSPFYGKCRYFMGALAVQDGDLASAVALFDEAAALSVDTVDARRVHDLSLLALGRIFYEQGQYLEAAEFYARIGADSEYAPEKLYEISWTFIRGEAWQDALRGIDIFLLAFPDHEFAPQLKLVKAKLHLAEAQYEESLSSFEEVLADYTPIRDRFAELASSGRAADRTYFREVLAISKGDPNGGGALPQYAVSMIKADRDLSRAIFVFSELEHQEAGIRTSEQIVRDLKLTLGADAHIGGYERMRYDALTTAWTGMEQVLLLLEVEDTWQRQSVSGSRTGSIEQLANRRMELAKRAGDLYDIAASGRKAVRESEIQIRRLAREALAVREEAASYERQIEEVKRRLGTEDGPATARQSALDDLARLQQEMDVAIREAESIEARLAQLGSAPGQPEARSLLSEGELSLLRDLETLRQDYGRNREPGADPEVGKRLDGFFITLARAQDRLQGAFSSVEKVERVELQRIRERFRQEVEDVARQRQDHQALLGEAETVSAALTRDGFGRLEDFFARSVLDADLGSVDVFWARKLEVADEIARVSKERQQLMTQLEQRFGVIRQKLGN